LSTMTFLKMTLNPPIAWGPLPLNLIVIFALLPRSRTGPVKLDVQLPPTPMVNGLFHQNADLH
jgi:hypothetical protein